MAYLPGKTTKTNPLQDSTARLARHSLGTSSDFKRADIAAKVAAAEGPEDGDIEGLTNWGGGAADTGPEAGAETGGDILGEGAC